MSQLVVAVKVLLVASCFYPAGGQSNKPGKKIIRTECGDIYVCVDFFKQSAFNHPVLKSTQLQGSPNVLSGSKRNKRSNIIGLKEGGCPYGTVPIRRAPKRNGSLQLLGGGGNISTNVFVYPDKGHYYAVVRTKSDPNKKFYGSEARMSIYNPSAKGERYTASQIRLSNGPDFIQAGWMVNPLLFGDLRSRLFVHFKAGDHDCYNDDPDCPGFVHVSSDVPIGYPAEKISVPGGQQFTWKISIKKDVKQKTWNLYLGEENYLVGYWPASIFTSLADTASQAEWGGEVYSPPGVPSPQMGSGSLPHLNIQYAADISSITLYDVHFNPSTNPEDTEQYVSSDVGIYNVQDMGFNGDNWGRVILYGGEGGAVA